MFQTLLSVAPLLLGAGAMMVGNSLLGILVPLKMIAADYSTEITGLIMAAYFGGLLVGSVYGQQLIGRVGHIRTFAGLAAILAAAALIYPLQFIPFSWGLLRFVSGLCIAGLFAAIESWLNERCTNETRGQVLGVYMVVVYGAVVVGQVMVNLWELDEDFGFIVGAILILLSLVPVALTKIEAPSLEDLEPLSPRALYDASPLAVVGSFIAGFVMGAYYGLGAVFAQSVGFNLLGVSIFVGSVIFGGMVLQWPIGRISDRFDRRSVLLVVLLLTALASLAAVNAPALADPRPALLGLGLLLGGTMTAIYPLCTAQAFDYIPRTQYVAASAGLMLAYAAGATVGPALCALAMGALGPYAFFGFIGTAAGAFAGFVFYRMQARTPLPTEEQEPYVVVPRLSPTAAELDPRTEAPEPDAEAVVVDTDLEERSTG